MTPRYEIRYDTDIPALLKRLDKLESAGDRPLAFASLDLRPDGSGSPTAPKILREALRSTSAEQTDDERVTSALEASIEDFSDRPGLFVAGPVEEPTDEVTPTPIAPRNTISVGRQAPRFELERYLALTRPVVGAVWANRGSMSWVRCGGSGAPVAGSMSTDPHDMRSIAGRTAQHGRGGSAETPAGGHGKTRIEESAEEARERFAREVAAEIESNLAAAQEVLLYGPVEFRSRLRRQLQNGVLASCLAEVETAGGEDPEDLVELAWQRCVELQYEGAAERLDAVTSGGLGDQGTDRIEAIVSAAEAGRLQAVVLDEDAVGHFGTALDTRRHEPRSEPETIERLLRLAIHGSGAELWFARSEDMAAHEAGAVGVLRW
ncbi:MAG: hypothetical protein AB1Z63_11135 [Candidatus Limnocylindrales bacterium]